MFLLAAAAAAAAAVVKSVLGKCVLFHLRCGCRSLFATLTRGSGMLHRAFQTYGHYKGPLDKVRKGVLISMAGLPPFLQAVTACVTSTAVANIVSVGLVSTAVYVVSLSGSN